MEIQSERSEDRAGIYQLIQAAFADKDYRSGTQGLIVNALRKQGDLTLSLVAIQSETLVGHIAFSPVSIAGQSENIYSLGPVAADPSLRF